MDQYKDQPKPAFLAVLEERGHIRGHGVKLGKGKGAVRALLAEEPPDYIWADDIPEASVLAQAMDTAPDHCKLVVRAPLPTGIEAYSDAVSILKNRLSEHDGVLYGFDVLEPTVDDSAMVAVLRRASRKTPEVVPMVRQFGSFTDRVLLRTPNPGGPSNGGRSLRTYQAVRGE